MPKILHPLNHSLLAITHEFLRWLFFTISAFTDIFQNNFLLQNCPWCSLHVSRCLIYKVHRCFRSLFKKRSGGLFHGNVSPRRDFSSLALRSSFVKNFFRLFSNRYAVSTNCPERAWIFYQSFSRMSTLFFDFFKIFFESQDIVSEVEIAPKI